ncbi:hypothetical protein REPUB_Repub16aG0035000 [Reevesia pubescens]
MPPQPTNANLKVGLANHLGSEKGGHAKFECPYCKTIALDLKLAQIHHAAKHPKISWKT